MQCPVSGPSPSCGRLKVSGGWTGEAAIPLSWSRQVYPDTGYINYDQLEENASLFHPKLIIAGERQVGNSLVPGQGGPLPPTEKDIKTSDPSAHCGELRTLA